MTGFSKTLLCVTGLSPQVVTETLYALAVQRGWIPNRICLITTSEGARRAKLSLLPDETGWFHKLCREFDLPEIYFSADEILTLTDATGMPMDDIRTPENNQRAADMIIDEVRRLTADPNSELHVSIAGGRKTMGFYLGYALSLFGRSQDRLSHVLVSAPFESCWDFFYPTRESQIVQVAGNDLADTRDAEVTLAEIPFVSLRHGMAANLLEGRTTFAEAVASVTRSLAPPELLIDLKAKRIQAAGQTIDLSPTSLALLAVFARRRRAGEPPIGAPSKFVPDQEWAKRFLVEYKKIRGVMSEIEQTEKPLSSGMDGAYFSCCKSRLHRELRNLLGPAARDYLISDGGARPGRYQLTIPDAAIDFVEIV
ncbi:MAG: hypothetical protein NPIRA05_18290 [Nitrospirales bacterium]|nr:MAG: hypothetical protein NPIRA05_18290 [Nitrospirales bacterium]